MGTYAGSEIAVSGSDWTIIDTETTGLAAPIYTLEIAAQRMRGLVPVGKPFRVFLNHEVNVPPQAQAVHGYSRKFIQENGIQPHQAHSLFAEYAGGTPLAAYNLPYDYDKVLMPEWKRLGLGTSIPRGFCVMRLTQKLLNPSPAGNYKLQSLRSHFRLPERSAHSAVGDVLTVVDLIELVLLPHLQRLELRDANAISRYLDDAGYSDRLPFGKHKGRHWKDAVSDQEMLGWLQWLARQDDQTNSRMAEWYLAKVKSAAASDSNRTSQKELLNKAITTRLKGTKHYGAYEAYRQNVLYGGAKLELKAEPQNPYDSNAVSVWIGKTKLGYINRDLAAKYQTIVLSEQITSCMISSLELASNGSKVEVYVRISYQDEIRAGIQNDHDIPSTSGVYEVRLDRGRCYIGSTYNLKLRRSQHLSQLQSNTHVNVHLQRDYNFLGDASVKFSVLAQSVSVEAARILEKEEIYRRLVNGVSLYNCTADGQGIFSEIGSTGDRTISDIYADNPAILEQYFAKGLTGASQKISPSKATVEFEDLPASTNNEETYKTGFGQLRNETVHTIDASPLIPTFTGKRRYEWPNGDRYEGDFVEGRRTGKGLLVWPNGDRYEGDFVDDKRTGKGIYLWPNGDRYDGDFVDDKLTGKGLLVWPNGARYDGDFVDDKRTGKGLLVLPNGDRYDGDFVDDKRTGKGLLVWPNGDRYEGDFVDDKRTGKGIYLWPNGDRYEGDFVDDKRTGKGIYLWPNGARYEGDFVEGRRTGKGSFIDANGGRKEGRFVDGQYRGVLVYSVRSAETSVLTWPDGRCYEGHLVNGKRTGLGSIVYPSGDRYFGEWVDDKCTGKGLFEYSNGDRYEGDFVDGRRVGKGCIWHANGSRYEGDFSNNLKHGAGKEWLSNGNRYEGQFYENYRHGVGKEWLSNGEKYEGEFKKNERSGRGLLILRDGSKFKAIFKNGKFVEKQL